MFKKSLCVICLNFLLATGGDVLAESGVTTEGDLPDPDLVFSDDFESPPMLVSIPSFTATPDIIDEGGTTTLSWSSVNAESCEATGGAGNWTETEITLPSGSTDVTIGTDGTYTFFLECLGVEGDQQTGSETVTVNDVPQVCDSVTLSGDIVSWNSIWSAAFPGPTYENVSNVFVAQKGYLAIEFNTADFIDDGKITLLENPRTPGIRIGAYSECPGDFNVPAECKFSWGLGGGLRWATNGTADSCELNPDTTYYFNVTFTDGEDLNTSNCDDAPCWINIQHVNF